jgi:hypothetical protein
MSREIIFGRAFELTAALRVLARLLALLPLSAESHTAGFIVAGDYEYTVPRLNKPVVHLRGSFKVTVRDCQWKIWTGLADGSQYREAGMEAESIHTVFWTSKSNLISASVENRLFPRDNTSNINYLWLAYASACYLRQQGTNWLHPIWTLDDPSLEEEDFRMEAVLELGRTDPLPFRLLFLSDGHRRTRGADRARLTAPMPAPFHKGFTNAEYRVVETIPLGSLQLPSHFAFTRWGVSSQLADGPALRVLTHSEFRVRSVAPLSGPVFFLPVVPGVADTQDTRFKHRERPVRSIYYKTTNASWPALTNIESLYRQEAGLQATLEEIAQRRPPPLTAKRWNVLMALLALTLAPAVVYVMRLARANR